MTLRVCAGKINMKVCTICKNSYIGNHIDQLLSMSDHNIFQLDVLSEDWRNFDYSPYDVVVQVAGIGIYLSATKDFSRVLMPYLLNTNLIDQSIQEKYEYAMKYHSKPLLLEYLERLVYSKCQ